MEKLMKRINKLLFLLRKNKNPIKKAGIALYLFILLIGYSCLLTVFLLFSRSQKSFHIAAERAVNGTYKHAYHHHRLFKIETQVFSGVSMIFIIVFSMAAVLFNLIIPPMSVMASKQEAQQKEVKIVQKIETSGKKVQKYPRINVTDYIKNSKGRVYFKDSVKVKDNLLVKDNINVKGVIKNTKDDDAVTVSDNFTVTGTSDFQDTTTINNLLLSGTDTSTLDTSTLQSGNIYYNSTDNILYLWNGTAWKDLTQQNSDSIYTAGTGISISESNVISSTVTDTDTNTTYTASDGIALSGTEFNLDENVAPNWTNTHTFEEDPTIQKTDAALIFDSAATGDTDYWAGVLDDGEGDDDDYFALGMGTSPGTTPKVYFGAGGTIGIGTVPTQKLHVKNGGIFLQHTTSHATLTIDAADTYDASLLLRENNTSKWLVGNDGDDSDTFKIQDWNSGWETDLSIDTSGNIIVAGEANVGGVSSDGDGSVVCVKLDGNLGTCSDQPGAGGTCTCGD